MESDGNNRQKSDIRQEASDMPTRLSPADFEYDQASHMDLRKDHQPSNRQ